MHPGPASIAFAALAVAAPLLAAAPAAVPFSAASIAPNGRTLAWVSGAHAEAQLHVTLLPAGDEASARLINPAAGQSNCSTGNPVWSPDSSTLAFTSTCATTTPGSATPAGSEQEQIFLYTAATGQTRQLTHLTGKIQDLAFSPDGKTLAFLFVENATRSAGALDAMKPWSGVIGEDGVEVQSVEAVSVSSGRVFGVTPSSLHAFEFTWAPDGRSLAFIAAPSPGENNWWIAKLYAQQLGGSGVACSDLPPNQACLYNGPGMEAPRVVLDPNTVSGPLHGLQLAVPRWSPDGQSIAVIGGLMSDQGSTGGDIYLVPATGGAPRDLTPNRPATPTWLSWLPTSVAPHTLLVSEDAQATTHLFRLNTATGTEAPGGELRYPGTLEAGGLKDALSITNTGEIAAVRSSFSDPPEVVAGPPAQLRAITQTNEALRGTGPRTESVDWTSDSFHVQGWLTFPAHFDASRHYPLLVSVHGGPSASIRSTWGQQSTYSDAGYFVFQPNPRGSFGQGERFTAANRKDFGYGDLRDILAGLDAVEHKYPAVDPHREALGGWSYGGFMTMFGVTQTHRFRAAIAGAGISDWQSYYGENSIDQWMTPFFGDSVYNDPAVYAKSSAINFIKQVTTPTLIIVGDRDGECPAPQSFEFWHALRAENVPTQLVIYPAEGHRFRDPAHIADRTRRELEWLAKYMPASDAATASTK